MNRLLGRLLMAMIGLGIVTPLRAAQFPTPSPYPISWELDFRHAEPKRIIVQAAGDPTPVAYWYMTYKVTNNTGQERMFLPMFLMLTDEGRLIRANNGVAPEVFDAIKKRENSRFMERPNAIAGELRVGEDEARESVAIWPEPKARMGRFTIFISGLSGEVAAVKDSDGQPVKQPDGTPVLLRKTLQLNYHIAGDEVYPGEDEVHTVAHRWIMR